ncbi:hypothetical protein FLA105534_01975 [Flavobacterium bizetiae]|uniref:Uncharacterized protein n=3 Tax=Flavobacterium bizetiae TaxID=2704140 RepID=A0A6J4GG21_9FLAO|nr:hypothetical protein FLA105534_01975 [Flavobacterium bizetiae]CAD5342337.1 hypothetical protein FLA105535_02322 [Flavobacterium bizetiae]CAD5348858.1 hypothetical protein FLA105534_02828 [Flavobacterium bizetiae]
MQRFNIYKKSKKFHWNNTLIIFTAILSLYIISIIKQTFFNPEKGIFEDIMIALMLLLAFIGLALKSIGLVKPENLSGEFTGFLEFYKSHIVVDQEKFHIDEIKSIEITNNDYYGKPNGATGFASSLSNGINNQILLRFNSGISKSYNFELYNESDMEKVEEELFSYYSQGKIDFFELVKILKIKSKTEIEDFRNKLALLK